MEKLISMFGILSLLAVVQMIIYGQFDGLAFLNVDFFVKTSLGNMGYSTAVCSKAPFFPFIEDYTSLFF